MATKRTKKTLGRAAVGITIVALAAVGLLGYQAAAGTSNNTNHYRTVTAAAGTLTQVLSLSGTVHHVTQSSVSFPTGGMVTAVNVKAGDAVTAGQALASINSTPLQNAVLAADAAYKSAIAQYQTDQETYASSSTTTSTSKAATTSSSRQSTSGTGSSPASSGAPSGTATPSGGGTGGTGAPGGSTNPAAAVKAATDAIAALQTGVQTVETALPIFIAECIPLIPTTTASPVATVTRTVTATATVTHTATVTVTVTAAASGSTAASSAASTASPAASSTTPKASASSTASSSASTPLPAACQAAIDTLTASQATLPNQMTAANVALAAAVKALEAEAATLQKEADTLTKQQAAQAAAASAAAAAAKQQASTLSSSNSALQAAAAAGLSRSGGGTVTAATLITDQSTIETTHIALAMAQDQLSQATITSPIAGKVASMPFIKGQQASATAAAVIIGNGAIEVSVPVPLAKRAQVATGQAATVTSTIGGTTLQGTISRIGLLPTTTTGFSVAAGSSTSTGANSSSSQSTTTYATVITIPSGGDLLPEGSRVGVAITTKTVNAAVVLPASAVTPTGTGSGTVQVVTNGILSTKRVVTGAVGEKDIEIVSGVTAGETVVIADVDKPIPGASIAASRGSQTAQQQQPQDFPTGGAGPSGAQPPAGGAPPT